MASRKPFDFELAASASGLTAEEIEATRREAVAEAEKELKTEAKKKLKAELTAEAKRARGLLEEHVDVTIDIAPYCDRLTINNRAYFHGVTYTVPAGLAQLMGEMMQGTWAHQSQVDGKPADFYRRNRAAITIGPHGVITTSQLSGA
jgi:hypothetical protein